MPAGGVRAWPRKGADTHQAGNSTLCNGQVPDKTKSLFGGLWKAGMRGCPRAGRRGSGIAGTPESQMGQDSRAALSECACQVVRSLPSRLREYGTARNPESGHSGNREGGKAGTQKNDRRRKCRLAFGQRYKILSCPIPNTRDREHSRRECPHSRIPACGTSRKREGGPRQ